MNEKDDQAALVNAEAIIERFGGIRPMASKMAIPVTTVQGWKKRNVIPGNRREDVMQAARNNNIDIADLVEKGAANQNGPSAAASAGPVLSTSVSSSPTLRDVPPMSSAPGKPEPMTASRPAAQSAVSATEREDIRNEIRAAGRSASRRSMMFSIILVAALGGAGAALLWPMSQQQAQQIAALQTHMQADENKIGLLQQGQDALSKLMPADLQQKIGSLKDQADAIQSKLAASGLDFGTVGQRLNALESQAAQAAGSASISELLTRLQGLRQSTQGTLQLGNATAMLNQTLSAPGVDINAALTTAQQQTGPLAELLAGVAPGQLKPAAVLIALNNLDAAVSTGHAPFDYNLTLLEMLLDGQVDADLKASVDQLMPQAKTGVMTPQDLRDSFVSLSQNMIKAAAAASNASLADKAAAQLGNLVQITKNGQPLTGSAMQTEVDQIQSLLNNGDIQGAVNEMKTLSGPAADAAQPFMADAQTTLLAQKVQEMFDKTVTSALGQPITGGGGGLLQQMQNALTPATPVAMPAPAPVPAQAAPAAVAPVPPSPASTSAPAAPAPAAAPAQP